MATFSNSDPYLAIERALRAARSRAPANEGPRSRQMWDQYQADAEPYGNRPWRSTPYEPREPTIEDVEAVQEALGVDAPTAVRIIQQANADSTSGIMNENYGRTLGLLQNHAEVLGKHFSNIGKDIGFGYRDQPQKASLTPPSRVEVEREVASPRTPQDQLTIVERENAREQAFQDFGRTMGEQQARNAYAPAFNALQAQIERSQEDLSAEMAAQSRAAEENARMAAIENSQTAARAAMEDQARLAAMFTQEAPLTAALTPLGQPQAQPQFAAIDRLGMFANPNVNVELAPAYVAEEDAPAFQGMQFSPVGPNIGIADDPTALGTAIAAAMAENESGMSPSPGGMGYGSQNNAATAGYGYGTQNEAPDAVFSVPAPVAAVRGLTAEPNITTPVSREDIDRAVAQALAAERAEDVSSVEEGGVPTATQEAIDRALAAARAASINVEEMGVPSRNMGIEAARQAIAQAAAREAEEADVAGPNMAAARAAMAAQAALAAQEFGVPGPNMAAAQQAAQTQAARNALAELEAAAPNQTTTAPTASAAIGTQNVAGPAAEMALSQSLGFDPSSIRSMTAQQGVDKNAQGLRLSTPSRSAPISGIVVHETVGISDDVVDAANTRGAGAHFYIDPLGVIRQMVSENKIINHIGDREVQNTTGSALRNSNTIGIEIQTIPGTQPNEAQVQAATGLARYLANKNGLDVGKDVVSHSDLAPRGIEGKSVVDSLRGKPNSDSRPAVQPGSRGVRGPDGRPVGDPLTGRSNRSDRRSSLEGIPGLGALGQLLNDLNPFGVSAAQASTAPISANDIETGTQSPESIAPVPVFSAVPAFGVEGTGTTAGLGAAAGPAGVAGEGGGSGGAFGPGTMSGFPGINLGGDFGTFGLGIDTPEMGANQGTIEGVAGAAIGPGNFGASGAPGGGGASGGGRGGLSGSVAGNASPQTEAPATPSFAQTPADVAPTPASTAPVSTSVPSEEDAEQGRQNAVEFDVVTVTPEQNVAMFGAMPSMSPPTEVGIARQGIPGFTVEYDPFSELQSMPAQPALMSVAQEQAQAEDDQDVEEGFSSAFSAPSSYATTSFGLGMSAPGLGVGFGPEGMTSANPSADVGAGFGGASLGQSSVDTAQAQMAALGLEGLFDQGFSNPLGYSSYGLEGQAPSTDPEGDDQSGGQPSGFGPSDIGSVDTSPGSSTDGPGESSSSDSSGGSASSGDSGGGGGTGGPGDGTGGMNGGFDGGFGGGFGSDPSTGGYGDNGGYDGSEGGFGGGFGNSGGFDGSSSMGGAGWASGGYVEPDRAILRAMLAAERLHDRDRKSRGGYVMPFARFANGGEIVENSVEYTPNGVIYSQVVQRALNAAKRRNAA